MSLTETEVAERALEAGLASPSIVLRSLDGPLDLSYEAAGPLYPASMIKTPLAAAAFLLVRSGLLTRWTPVPVEPANMTANDLSSPLVPGYEARVDELIELMISRSDNVATNLLIDVVGRQRATALMGARGLHATAVRRKLSGSEPLIDDPEANGRNSHPAADAAALFEALARGTLPYAADLRGALARQRWNTKLSRGLAPGDRFAHKTGDTSEVSHDGGILTTGGGRYVIVVYSASPSSQETDTRFAAFMRAVRPHLA